MKTQIELIDEEVDKIVKAWLREMVELSEHRYSNTDDMEFWGEFGQLCGRILEMNFKWVKDE